MTGLLLVLMLGLRPQAEGIHALIVTGIGGEPKYSASFVDQAGTLITHLVDRYGMDPVRITWLAEAADRDSERIRGRSTRERVAAELLRISKVAQPTDRVLVVFIGHGSDAGEPKLNLPGPDLGATELGRLLESFPTQSVALVFAASASGRFVERLQGPNRLIMTATKTGFERNETVFGGVFSRAFGGEAADTDKDGLLSLAEVFTFTTHEVARVYEADNRLQTEHARLSDSTLARRFVFVPGGVQSVIAAGDSIAAQLLSQKMKLEREIESLRALRETIDSVEYSRRLEDLIVELALVNRRLRERRGVPQ